MPIMLLWTLISNFFKKHWLPIALIVSMLGLWLFFSRYYYNKGFNNCTQQVQKQALEDQQKREKEYNKSVLDNNKKKKKLFDDIKNNPINDKRDSCILSGNPLAKDCLGD